MKLKILLTPIGEKLPSFKVMTCPFWSSEPFTGLEMENIPRLNQNFGEREVQSWGNEEKFVKNFVFF